MEKTEELYREIIKAKDKEISDLKEIISKLTWKNPYEYSYHPFTYTETTYGEPKKSVLDDISESIANGYEKAKTFIRKPVHHGDVKDFSHIPNPKKGDTCTHISSYEQGDTEHLIKEKYVFNGTEWVTEDA